MMAKTRASLRETFGQLGCLVVGTAALTGFGCLVISCNDSSNGEYYEEFSSHKVEEIAPYTASTRHNFFRGYSTFFTENGEVVRRDYSEHHSYYDTFSPSTKLKGEITKRHGSDFLSGCDYNGLKVVSDLSNGETGRADINEFGFKGNFFSGDEIRTHVTIHLAKDKKIVGEGK